MFRYLRRRIRKINRLRGKRAAAWYCIFAVGGFFVLNSIYQVIRKPGAILASVSDSFSKSPKSTWQSYGSLFEEHSTSIISPEFLAALAQVESDGNPIAVTSWRWEWSWNPFKLYRPASSALGMFQFTDGTFAEARKYCIRDHRVTTDGPWHDFHSCWFNSFYARTIPSHAIEMTAAYLHQSVLDALADRPGNRIALAQKQRLAAVIHLCGAKRGEAFVRQGFRLASGARCGAHSLHGYLLQVDRLKKRFGQLRRSVEQSEGGRNLSLLSVSPSGPSPPK
jgi:Transglycosylase SLT domain